MHADEERFIRAIAAAPDDEATRLVYADWLEEHGHDPRAAYLRAEAACFRLPREERKYECEEAEGVDPVWANMVSRTGILVQGLTLTDTGPRISPDDLKELKAHWGQPLPPDYTAFMLLYNGGTVIDRHLFSWREQEEADGEMETRYFHGHIRLFPLGETDEEERPYHRTPASAICPGPLTDGDEQYDFGQMMPIGTVTYYFEDDSEDVSYLGLVMDPEAEEHCLVLVCYDDGLEVDDDHSPGTVSNLLHSLEASGRDDPIKTGSPYIFG